MDSIWQNREKILQGIKNALVKNSYVESIAEERYKICAECLHIKTNCAPLIKECCGKCGCSLKFKTRSLDSSCPINKWPKINDSQ